MSSEEWMEIFLPRDRFSIKIHISHIDLHFHILLAQHLSNDVYVILSLSYILYYVCEIKEFFKGIFVSLNFPNHIEKHTLIQLYILVQLRSLHTHWYIRIIQASFMDHNTRTCILNRDVIPPTFDGPILKKMRKNTRLKKYLAHSVFLSYRQSSFIQLCY